MNKVDLVSAVAVLRVCLFMCAYLYVCAHRVGELLVSLTLRERLGSQRVKRDTQRAASIKR